MSADPMEDREALEAMSEYTPTTEDVLDEYRFDPEDEYRALRDAIWASWCKETSADPERWSVSNRALGQCAVTALVIQDYLGGDLLRTTVDGLSHYWNMLPNGREVDLTRRQFIKYRPVGRESRDRAYVLSYPETRHRYALLASFVARRLERDSEKGSDDDR